MSGSEFLMRRAAARAPVLLALPLVAALVSGCGSKANSDTFDLSITPSSQGVSARNRQILVPEPTARPARAFPPATGRSSCRNRRR